MEGFALRDAGDDGRAPLALRPIHLALVAFVATLPAHAPTIGAFAEAPQFEAIADTFLFALLLAAVTSSVVVLLRGRCPCWWRNGPEPWPSPSTRPSSCALSSC